MDQVPDPTDPNYVWSDLENGVLIVLEIAKARQRAGFRCDPTTPFPPGSFLGPFDLSQAKYRFNWDSPMAFAPWDGHIAWFGGNVVFQSTDRGLHWTVISPDLTRNVKEHQLPSGGPLAKDVSGAEYSDTLLYIEGSQLNKGEIWAGADDGVASMTRDGGEHWENVTPPGTPEYARIEATVRPLRSSRARPTSMADDHQHGQLRALCLRDPRLRQDVEEDR